MRSRALPDELGLPTSRGVAVLIMIGCAALLLVGLALGVKWIGVPFVAPEIGSELTPTDVVRRFVWYWAVTLTAGIAAGITVMGAGGRLAMRLLAVTGGAAAQGRTTEANEIVGRITFEGTFGFVVFTGVVGGLTAMLIYLVVRHFLPAGRLGGVMFGFGLLVVFGAVLDPLRKQNPDFDIVGPGWLAVIVFAALAIGFGVTAAGMSARMSTWLPLFSTERQVLLRYLAPAAIAAVAFAITAVAAVVCLATILVTRSRSVVTMVRSPRLVSAGRVLLLAAVLLSVPNTLRNVIDIAGR